MFAVLLDCEHLWELVQRSFCFSVISDSSMLDQHSDYGLDTYGSPHVSRNRPFVIDDAITICLPVPQLISLIVLLVWPEYNE